MPYLDTSHSSQLDSIHVASQLNTYFECKGIQNGTKSSRVIRIWSDKFYILSIDKKLNDVFSNLRRSLFCNLLLILFKNAV